MVTIDRVALFGIGIAVGMLIMIMGPANAQQSPLGEYNSPLQSYQSDFLTIPGFNAPLRDEGPSFYDTFMQDMDAQHRERERWIMESFRATAPQRRRNALAVCAQYNVGCAQELYGSP